MGFGVRGRKSGLRVERAGRERRKRLRQGAVAEAGRLPEQPPVRMRRTRPDRAQAPAVPEALWRGVEASAEQVLAAKGRLRRAAAQSLRNLTPEPIPWVDDLVARFDAAVEALPDLTRLRHLAVELRKPILAALVACGARVSARAYEALGVPTP